MNEVVFFLEKRNGAFEPLYLTPTMGDGTECIYRDELGEAQWERANVRLPGMGERMMNVLAVERGGQRLLYLPWSEWELVK